MSSPVVFLFVFTILVTIAAAWRDTGESMCQDICNNKEGDVISARRPSIKGTCIAAVCFNCTIVMKRISDCWSIHTLLRMKINDKTKCIFKGEMLRALQMVKTEDGSYICADGKLSTITSTNSLLSNIGAAEID